MTLTSALVLGLACLILAAYDLRRAYRDLQTDLVSLAQLIGAESTGALTFDDARAADDILAAMKARTHIVSARLFDAKGRPFATYRRPGSEGDALPEHPLPDSYRASRSHAVLFESVKLGNETAGTLYLKADLGELRSHFEGYLVIVLLVMLASVALATVLSARGQHLVIAPILRLADAAGAVTRDKDYSVRVASAGADELGVLTSAFNEMLSQIERRDAELRAEVKERQHAEEQLRQAQKMEAVGRLAGGVAHDFNNLLTVITGLQRAAPARPRGRRPDRAGTSTQIRKAGERAAALTRQLLAFSRKQVLRAQGARPQRASSPTSAQMLRRLIGEDVELVIVARPDAGRGQGRPRPDRAGAHEPGGQRARRHAERRHAHHRDRATSRWTRLARARGSRRPVRHAGRHATPASAWTRRRARRIFEPFFTTKEPGKGTGPGPGHGVRHRQAERRPHRGRQRARAGHDLPALPAPRRRAARRGCSCARPQAERPRARRRSCWSRTRRRPRADRRHAARARLHGAGGGRGSEALLLDDGHPGRIDLLVTDVVMPGMSGPQVALEMTRRRPAIKVVFLSGYSDEALGARGVLDPGTVLLPKPFTGAALDLCLAQVLGQAPKTELTGTC